MRNKNPYNDNVKLHSIELPFLSFEFFANGAHPVWRDAFVLNTKVELVYHSLTDVHSQDAFDMRNELFGEPVSVALGGGIQFLSGEVYIISEAKHLFHKHNP